MADPKPSGSEQGSVALVTQKVSLGMIANTVEQFSGKNVKRYFEKIKQRAKLDEWDEKTTLNLIKYRLTGDAYNYFKTDSTLDSDNFANFKNKFIKRFSPVVIPGQGLINLNKCYQRHDETVNQFVTRLKLIGVEILDEDLQTAAEGEVAGIKKKVDQLVLNQFKAGLSRHLLKNVGTVLMREKNLTIDRAEELATQEELNDLMLRPRHPNMLHINNENKGNQNCFKCNRPGHYARFCRANNYNNNSQSRTDWERNHSRREQNRYNTGINRSQGNRENNYYRGGFNRDNENRDTNEPQNTFQSRNLHSNRQPDRNLGAVPRRNFNNQNRNEITQNKQVSLNAIRAPPTVPQEEAWD